MAVFYDNRWVSVPCPDGKPRCDINHMVLRADYDKLRQEQKDASAEWTRQYEKGIEDEQNRIIKLLTEGSPRFIVSDGFGIYVDKEALTAIVKGENK